MVRRERTAALLIAELLRRRSDLGSQEYRVSLFLRPMEASGAQINEMAAASRVQDHILGLYIPAYDRWTLTVQILEQLA